MEIGRVNKTSSDLLAKNIETLKRLFPEVVSEGHIHFDLLKVLLGGEIHTENEFYHFEWHGKRHAMQAAIQPTKGTLRPDINRSINFHHTENLFIEGDNLEVLKILQKSYSNKIKMIYIDPPYNTGNDFIYKDNFTDSIQNYLEQTGQTDEAGKKLRTNLETSGRKHTNWLNMMYPRLKLARNLLTENGVIFISIDDHESHHLKRICDEIFGEANYIATCVRKRRNSQANLSKNISPIHEYVYIYAKQNGNVLNKIKANINEQDYKNPDSDPRGPYVTMPCTNKGGAKYSVTTPMGVVIEEEWRFKKETYNRLLHDNRIVFPNGGKGKPRYKIFLSEKMEEGVIPNTWLDNISSNQEATKELKGLFDGLVLFDMPKPVGLLEHLLEIGADKDSIILDFFSGSATTAHATMKLNAEDGGNRKFIMVQLPEKLDEKSVAYQQGYRTISDIGQERIRRAGHEIVQGNPNKRDCLDIGYKVLYLDQSNIREWNVDFDNLEEQITSYDNMFVPGRTELDVVYEIMLKYGLELTNPIDTFQVDHKNVYDIAFGNLFICLDEQIDTTVAKSIIEKREAYGIDTSSVVFADHGFQGNDSEKLNCFRLLQDAGYQNEHLMTI